jgi:hypothetical protein
MRQFVTSFTLILAFALAFVGCSDDPASSNYTGVNVGFQNTAPSVLDGTVYGNPGDSVEQITITSARVVVSMIEFTGDGTGTYRSTEHEPIIVNLDLSGNMHRLGFVEIPAGTYSTTTFRIQALQPTDSGAWGRYPDMRNVSVRVEGYINDDPGNTFIFTTELDEEQNRQMEPFTINEGESHLVTFRFDHTEWFRDTDGSLLHPDNEYLAAGRSIVEDNIVQAFDVY